jgi:hypothetical protein
VTNNGRFLSRKRIGESCIKTITLNVKLKTRSSQSLTCSPLHKTLSAKAMSTSLSGTVDVEVPGVGRGWHALAVTVEVMSVECFWEAVRHQQHMMLLQDRGTDKFDY